MYRIFCVLLLGLFAIHVESGITNCGSSAGNFQSVTVSDCNLSETTQCILKRGRNATITIVFNVAEDTVTNVTSIVHGILAGVPIPFNLPNPDGCKNGLPCPLTKSGGPYTYVNTLHVDRVYPPVSLKVQWELKTENGTDIVCAEIPAKIK